MRRWVTLAMVAGASISGAQHAAAQEWSGNDLRNISVGMTVANLSSAGYADFHCAADAKLKLSGWADWRSCPTGENKLRAVRFGYDPAESRDGTLVAGHPAVLTALIDETGNMAGLRIETDPTARLYLRKKAFLLGQQVKARYGAEGWVCTQAQPEAGEEPVGGVYLRERCTKTAHARALVVERNLYRKAGQDQKSFVDETRVTIRQARS
jgi:hypothetical protein